MASALENFVNNVRTLSVSGNFRDLVEYLNDSVDLLTKNWGILDNVLETLDIQQHSLGVMFVLIGKFANTSSISTVDSVHLVRLFKDFVVLCNGEQVRFASYAYYELCHLFSNFVLNQRNCIQGIKLLAQALDKIRNFDSQLTTIHADLCQISLKAKCFKIVIKLLDIDITSIAAIENKVQNGTDPNNDAKYFLLYYYYGGMIYITMKNFDRALYFFEIAISTPAMAMSHIMLESYKKFILVSLILHGKIINVPKYSSQVTSRFMKPLSQVYHELAIAYVTSSSDELRTVISKYNEVFVRDINMGLVKQVASSLYKKNIQRLTKTFLTLSLSDVASRVQLPSAIEAEKYILQMIKSGEIYATVNQKDGMVVFKDNPEKYDSPGMFLRVQEDVTQAMDLIKQINKMEEEIVLNPMYVKKSIGNQEEDIASGQNTKPYSSDPTD